MATYIDKSGIPSSDYVQKYWPAMKDGSSNSPPSWQTFYIDAPYWYASFSTYGSNGSSGAQIDVQIYGYSCSTGKWTSYGTKTCSAHNNSESLKFYSTDFNSKCSNWKWVIRTWGYYAWFGSYKCDAYLYMGSLKNSSAFPSGSKIGYSDINIFSTSNYSSDSSFVNAKKPTRYSGQNTKITSTHRLAAIN